MSKPSTPHLSNRLRQLALASSPATALFYARLYHALVPNNSKDGDSLHILALCFIQSQQPYSAIHLCRDLAGDAVDYSVSGAAMHNPSQRGCDGCAVIVGRCCEMLGRYTEGKEVMERALRRSQGSVPTNLPTPYPSSTSASTHLMMATLSHKGKAPEQAVEGYSKALTEDGWLWEAFTGLCDVGAPPAPEQIFPSPPQSRQSRAAPSGSTSRHPTLSPNPPQSPMPRSSASEIPGIPTRRQMSPLVNGGVTSGGLFTPDAGSMALPRVGMMGNPSSWDTPGMADTTFPTITEHPAQSHPVIPLPQPSRRPLPNLLANLMPTSFRSTPTSHTTSTPVNADLAPVKPPAMKRPRGGPSTTTTRKTVDAPVVNGAQGRARDLKSIEPNGEEGIVRRSTRLKTGPTKPPAKTSRDKRPTRSRSITSSTSGAAAEAVSPPAQEPQLQQMTDKYIRDIVRRCGKAYRAQSVYACQQAIDEVEAMFLHYPLTATFVVPLQILALATYELGQYARSKHAFERIRSLEPYNLVYTEYYSTVLWHLGEHIELSNLSQWLIAIDRETSPQVWICVGNTFSLKQDHEQAMKCFKRATQIDPSCTYAWTLCGYEAIEMEEYDRAVAFYRTAIRNDPRHYNAWYGMGLVYLKQGKPKHAEHHFRRAAEINPSNAVLLCCIGAVLEQSDDVVQALTFYDHACKFAPDSAMVAYKRIRVLVALQRIDEAISLLEPLCKKSPDEANIHFLLGKCYLKVDRRVDATVSFTAARELNPKLENGIKVAMGGGEEDEDEQSDDE